MITILTTTNNEASISEAINSVDRLDELVSVVMNNKDIETTSKLILVDQGFISAVLDWNDTEPPYVFPKIPYSIDNLLALIFYKLGNHQRAFEFLTEANMLFHHLLTATQLQFGYDISDETFSKIKMLHNQCIVQHYGKYKNNWTSKELDENYQKAIVTSANDEIKVFTAKHYANYLLDAHNFNEAEQLMRSLYEVSISPMAENAIDIQLASALMAQLHIPYDQERLKEILALFNKGISFYEAHEQKINAGLLYLDASEVANFQGDYIISKDLINKAIQYFKEEDIPEFLGEAGFRKATLLYTWSKNGSPQYYKPAINAFQDTLKIFKRDTHPQKFADVHHNLALIYSEIPVSLEEKPIWTAFCASSFKEALNFYEKDEYAYQHAMVSHNYATALMSFPEAKLHNNLDKADGLFQTALEIRTANDFPFERALTLINQLELFWLMHNENSEEESKKYTLMINKVNEIKELVNDEVLIDKANDHLEALKNLKIILN